MGGLWSLYILIIFSDLKSEILSFMYTFSVYEYELLGIGFAQFVSWQAIHEYENLVNLFSKLNYTPFQQPSKPFLKIELYPFSATTIV